MDPGRLPPQVLGCGGAQVPCPPYAKPPKAAPHAAAQFVLGSKGANLLHFRSRPAEASVAVKQDPGMFSDSDSPTGLLLELCIPDTTLQQLHSSAHGSLAEFLHALHVALSTAVHVSERRINILGIRGQYKRVDPTPTKDGGIVTLPQHIEEMVLVRFEVTSADGNGTDERGILERLREQLATPSSCLRTGPFGHTLQNATVTLGLAWGIADLPRTKRDNVARMSAMALPIGISAAFTGILIWLAAW